MVDIASLKSMLANRPSLLDHMSGGRGGNVFDALTSARANGAAMAQAMIEDASEKAGSKSVNVTLSAEAQAILNAKNPDGTSNPAMSGVQKGAADFIMSFFDEGDIDLSNLSEDTINLVHGFQSMIADSGLNQRDLPTDMMEANHHKGARKAYTLVGGNNRMRIAIDYDSTGKPGKLTLTDMTGGKVEIAEISLLAGKDGQAESVLVEREGREYTNGTLAGSIKGEPITIPLYGA